MRIQRAAVFVIALVPVMAAAQQFLPNLGPPVDPNTRFEVVAIKAFDETVSGQVLMQTTPGRFEASLPVGLLLRQALQMPDYQIVGAPGWIDTTRYSIRATVPAGVSPLSVSVLLANLLKDRFQLATHRESRELPVINLVMARPDGRLGPNLTATSAACQAVMEARAAAALAPAAGRGGPPPVLPAIPGPDDPLPCGFVRNPPGRAGGSGFGIVTLVRILADVSGRTVVDKTGLTGLYDFTLKYAPEPGRAGSLLGVLAPQTGAPPAAIDPDAPSLAAALQEQLGLKLENARAPVEVVVIDKLEKPTLD